MPAETETRYGQFAINLLAALVILTVTLSGAMYAIEHDGTLAGFPVLAGGYLATLVAEYYLTGEIHV